VSLPEDRLIADARFVHGLARALLRDRELAADVAQSALVAALQQKAAPRDWRNWLAAVTRRLASAAQRGQHERREREAHAAAARTTDREARAAAELRLHRQLCDAVLALPEPYRTTVTLRFLDGLPPRAIARQLQRDAALVRQHLHRGLALLRQQLDAEFGDRDGWRAAFAACGLGLGGAATLTLLPVLAMKKLAVAAIVVLATGAWWLADSGPMPRSASTTGGNTVAAASADAAAAARPEPAATEATPLARTTVAFVVRVVDEDDRPQSGVTVRCWHEQGDAVVVTTGRDGTVEFAPDEGQGVLRVEGGARPPLLRQVTKLVGEERVVLPRGMAVSGVLTIDGAPAPAGLELHLASYGNADSFPLPERAAQWLLLNSWRYGAIATTDARGAFAFHGLPADWRGGLDLPQSLWVMVADVAAMNTDSPNSLRLEAPREGLVVAATRMETVSGRVVWDDTGEPIAEAGMNCGAVFENGEVSSMFGHAADRSGRFAVGFFPSHSNSIARWLDPEKRSPIVRCTFAVIAPGAAQTKLVEVGREQIRSRAEVLIRVPRAAVSHFLAVDDQQRPIAGARVRTSTPGISAPTGADGRGTFAGPRNDLLIGAPGYAVIRGVPSTAAAGTAADPLTFVLGKDNALQVHLRTPAGAPVTDVSVMFRSKGPLFLGRSMQSELDREFGSTQAWGSVNFDTAPDGTQRITSAAQNAEPDRRGDIVLHSLEPGVPCTVVALDYLATTVATAEFVTPARGVALSLDLVVAAAPRRIVARVMTRDGAPLADAKVKITAGDGQFTGNTQRDGRFEFTNSYTDVPVRLTVSHPGYAAQQSGELARARDGEVNEFRLVRGNTVRVTVRDAANAIVPVHIAIDMAEPLTDTWQTLAPGDYAFADLPPGDVVFACTIGGERFELRHDTSKPEAVLHVPTPGRIAIPRPEGLPDPKTGACAVWITCLDAARAPVQASFTAGEESLLLLPGRYRVQLVWTPSNGSAPIDSAALPSAEFAVRAGESVRVALR
jgi:RNA polymerase sigma factor (sigma-70 family)